MSIATTEHRIPTTAEIRHDYARGFAVDEDDINHREHLFDLWLAEHDRQVAEHAWDQGWKEGVDVTDSAYLYNNSTVDVPASRDNNPYLKKETE